MSKRKWLNIKICLSAYQNRIQSFMVEVQSILDRGSNVTKVENTYLRHKVMSEAEDETVLTVPETEYL